jgi:hypothetical protein
MQTDNTLPVKNGFPICEFVTENLIAITRTGEANETRADRQHNR